MHDQQAIDLAFLYYCRGYSDERIEKAMRTGEGNDENAYPGWSRQLLYDRPINGRIYDGWKTKYNWEKRRAEIDARRVEFEKRAEDIEDEMLDGLSTVVRTLLEKIKQSGKGVDSQTIHGFVNTAKLLMDIKKAKGSPDDSPIKEAKKEFDSETLERIEKEVYGL